MRACGFDPLLSVVNAQMEFLFLMIASWVNRQQQAVIEYLKEENSMIRMEILNGNLAVRVQFRW